MKGMWVAVMLMGVLIFGAAGWAGATTYQWSFDTASNIEPDSQVCDYMTMIYGSTVTATNVKIDDTGWGSGRYLTTDDSNGLSIVFATTPISKLYGTTDGWVFDANGQWPWQATNYDFTLSA